MAAEAQHTTAERLSRTDGRRDTTEAGTGRRAAHGKPRERRLRAHRLPFYVAARLRGGAFRGTGAHRHAEQGLPRLVARGVARARSERSGEGWELNVHKHRSCMCRGASWCMLRALGARAHLRARMLCDVRARPVFLTARMLGGGDAGVRPRPQPLRSSRRARFHGACWRATSEAPPPRAWPCCAGARRSRPHRFGRSGGGSSADCA